jgi:uncharacterized protein (TIGR02594 family)
MTLRKRNQAAILLASVAFVVFTVPALARPVHHKAAHAIAAMPAQNTGADQDSRYSAATQQAAGEATQGQSRRRAVQAQANSALGGFTSDSLVSEARKYIGTNPTGRGSLWCGAFMDLMLKKTGHAGGGNLASAYARYGTRVSGPQVGAIAVMGRRGGGHVGVVTGIDANGNPIVLSGNTWNRSTGGRHTVAESVYPRGRIYAYVMP